MAKRDNKTYVVNKDNILTYNHWVTFSSSLFLFEYFYNRIICDFALYNIEPTTINIEDTKQLFYALEPLYEWINDDDRRERAKFKK